MVEIHDDIVLRYGGGAPGYNYPDLLPYAVDKPFLVLFGKEQYPGAYLKAAVMMETINRGHPFTDGNKRTGYLAGITLLELLTGHTVEATDQEIVDISLAVESGTASTQELAGWMKDHSVLAY